MVENPGELIPLLHANNTQDFKTLPQHLIYFFESDPLLRRIVLSVLLKKPDLAYLNEDVGNNGKFCLRGPTLHLSNNKAKEKAEFVTRFFQGTAVVTEKIWPASLSVLLLHDSIRLWASPETGYGNTAFAIFAGLSPNQVSMATTLGSQVIGDFHFWFWPILLPIIPVLAGIGNYIYKRKSVRINPELSRYQFELLWGDELQENAEPINADNLLNHITDNFNNTGSCFNNTGNCLAVFRALTALANIANSFNGKDLEKLSPEGQEVLKQLKTNARNALLNFPLSPAVNIRFTNTYYKYLLWSMSETELLSFGAKVGFALLTIVRTVFMLYAKWRLYQYPIRMLWNYTQFRAAEKACHDENKIWQFNAVAGDYDCSICGDWPFVYPGDIYSAQGCLDSLMRWPNSPETIATYLAHIFKQPGSFSINLSKQNWKNWTDNQFANVTRSLESLPSIKILDLSSASLTSQNMTEAKFNYLIQLVQNVTVEQLNLANQGWGHQSWSIVSNVKNGALTSINLSGNNLDDYHILTLSNGLSALSQLEHLNISQNQFTGKGFQYLAAKINGTKLRSLDVSNNDLSLADFTLFWQATNNATLEEFSVMNSGINAGHLIAAKPYLNGTSLKQIIFSDNRDIDNAGVYYFFTGLQNTTSITSIDLSNTGLTDVGMRYIADYLPFTNIEYISLNGIKLSERGLSSLFNLISLNNSHLRGIDLANMELNDDHIILFSQALNRTQTSWTVINLNDNRITNRGGNVLAAGINAAKPQQLSLANNLLSSDAGIVIINSANSENIKSLDLSHNLLDSHITSSINKLIDNNIIQEINLEGNAIGDITGSALAKHLIQPIPQMDNLGSSLSLDQRRALHAAQPATHLTFIGLKDTNITTDTARVLCQVLPASHVPLSGIDIKANQINSMQVDIRNCQISGASIIQPLSIYRDLATTKQKIMRWFSHLLTSEKPDYPQNRNSRRLDERKLKKANRKSAPLIFKDEQNRPLYSLPAAWPYAAKTFPQCLPANNARSYTVSIARNQAASQNPAQPTMVAMLVGTVPIILGVIVIYLFYRSLTPSLSRLSREAGLFKDTQKDKQQEKNVKQIKRYLNHSGK